MTTLVTTIEERKTSHFIHRAEISKERDSANMAPIFAIPKDDSISYNLSIKAEVRIAVAFSQ